MSMCSKCRLNWVRTVGLQRKCDGSTASPNTAPKLRDRQHKKKPPYMATILKLTSDLKHPDFLTFSSRLTKCPTSFCKMTTQCQSREQVGIFPNVVCSITTTTSTQTKTSQLNEKRLLISLSGPAIYHKHRQVIVPYRPHASTIDHSYTSVQYRFLLTNT